MKRRGAYVDARHVSGVVSCPMIAVKEIYKGKIQTFQVSTSCNWKTPEAGVGGAASISQSWGSLIAP